MSMVPRPPRKKGVKPVATNHNHVVRVTVLGLAGITVDRLKCRDKSSQESAPVEPRKMKAVVAFSRNSNMKGMSALSKHLARSPSDDIVVGQQGKLQVDDETATHTTGTVDRPQRHVAVWASDTSSLGSVVSFEVPLMSSGKERYAPKSFDLTIALAEDEQNEHHVALPFGVATLAISGNECKHGRSVKLDLPVLSLSAARPLKKVGGEKRRGVGGYPMIAISPKTKDLPKKRTGLQRLFNRQEKVQVPTETARNSFADAYAMDANGDAILRVSLEVYEKGSELEKTFKSRNLRGDSSIASSLVPSLRRSDPGEVPFDERSKRRSDSGASNGAPSDEENTLATKGDATLFSNGTSYDAATHDGSDTFDGTFEGTFDGTFEGTFFDGDEDDESGGSETYATNEENVGFFTWPNQADVSEDHDSYTLSFEKKESGAVEAAEPEDGPDPLEIDFFGRKIKIPMCASLPLMRPTQDEDEDTSLVTRATKGGLNRMVHDFQDDMTHVTADFFGKSYRIPVCAAIRGMDDDDFTFVTEGETLAEEKDKKNNGTRWTNKVCHGGSSDDLDLSKTFSTLSDGRGEATTAVASKQGSKQGSNQSSKGTTVKEILQKKEGMVPTTPEKRPGREAVPHDSPDTKSATDWLLSPKKAEQNLKKAISEASPTTIHDFPPMESAKPQEEVKAKELPVAKTLFTDFFGFKREVAPTTPVKYEPYQQEVPPIVIPDEEASVGELTANTFEANIASEAQILERYRKKFHNQSTQAKKGRKPSRMIPVAFGGDGMCPGMTVQVASAPIRVTSGGSNSLLEGAAKKGENYFAEYDDFSIISPAFEPKATVSPPRIKEAPIREEPEKEEKRTAKPTTELKEGTLKTPADKVSKKTLKKASRKGTRSSSRVR